MFKSATLALLVAGATSVRAHGYVQNVSIGGQTYQGFHPFEDPYASPVPQTVVRKVADDGPINFDAAELTCNKNGQQGNGMTATVPAGQDVTWTMNRWPDDHKGSISVYMANCNGNCDSFDGSGNSWFKISSEGLIDAGKFYWGSDKLIQAGNSWTQTIPSNIQAGSYLMRLEILALHSAGQPQFYPSCTQVEITGGGDGAPGQSELVSFPGFYKQGDQSIFGDIWSSPQNWPQVGPDVAAFVQGGSAPAPAPSPTPSSSNPAPTSSDAGPTSDPAPTSSDPGPSSDPAPTSDPETSTTPTSTKSHRSSTAKPTATSKMCRRKVAIVKKSSLHATKRNTILRPFGKRRL